jgi:hypothetical protein
MTPEELEHLVARAADGSLTAGEASALVSACRESDEALRLLACHLGTERLLHMVERDPHGRIAAQEVLLRIEQKRLTAITATEFAPEVVRHARRSQWWLRASAAAAVLVAAGLMFHFSTGNPPKTETAFAVDGPTSERIATGTAVAVLKRSVGVEWTENSSSHSVGAMLPDGWMRLKSGTLEIEFLGGARLIVVGPAELRMDAEDEAFLQSGTASAYVPEPARGFQLRGPGVDVVDLGTSFGFSVGSGRKPEVHVFDGEVTVAGSSGAPRKLEAEKAVRVEGADLHEIPVRPADFPDGAKLAQHADTDARSRFSKWRSGITSLAADPAVLLCYTFEGDKEWERVLTNVAPEPAPESHGAIVGAGWTGGRWPGKRALEFRSLGDRLRFSVPGSHSALTLMAWVRVDSLPNDYNSLLLPTRYGAGALHWTLERGGELRLTMRSTDAPGNGVHYWEGPVSGPAVSNMDFGRWLFLATTYDAATGMVTHYRDGIEIGHSRFKKHLPAVLGSVEFGNWGADGTKPDNAWVKGQLPNQFTRNFVGRLDELLILSRAMPADEIARHYTDGAP